MKLDIIPDALDEWDTPEPLKTITPRYRARKPLPPLPGMSDKASAKVCWRGLRPSGAKRAGGTKAAESAPLHGRPIIGAVVGGQSQLKPPRVTASATREPTIEQRFADCTNAAQEFESSQTRRTDLLIRCLQMAARLYKHGHSTDREGYDQLLARHQIRETGRTQNPFSPVVKLMFSTVTEDPHNGAEKGRRTSLSRYAGVLRYAHDNEVEVDDYPGLLTEEGGLEGCAKRDREANPSRERQAAATKRAAHLQALKAHGQNADLTVIGKELPNGLTALLVEKDPRGVLRVLGARDETGLNARRYRPL